MSKPIIKIENLSKQYRLGTIGTGTIAHDLNRWYQTKIMRREDPYLKLGEVNDRAHKGISEYVWALKDINLEVNQGDVVGVIGRNGAGKSTLLKILSRVTAPTTGSVKIRGRLASLLEVGTGFHPELTGRENIFLNGAILGMTKAEIRSKLDEIIDFSGVERYVDTPVKRYSSGMSVRLGFAVAAFLEPEILIVDEVLAVGDAEFQKKAIGKMQDVSNNQGRTVLFVSHNMASIQALCQKGVVMKNGSIDFAGDIESTINHYLSENVGTCLSGNWENSDDAPGNDDVRVISVDLEFEKRLTIKNPIRYRIKFELKKPDISLNLSSHFYNLKGDMIFNLISESRPSEPGIYEGEFTIPGNLLNDDSYYISTMFVENSARAIYNYEQSVIFDLIDERENMVWFDKWRGMIRPTSIPYSFDKVSK